MKIHYSSTKLEKILTSPNLLKKYYANDYNRLINRLSEFRAANSLADISSEPPPRRHKLSGDMAGMWGINYSKNDRIIICPMSDYDEDDLTTITEIKIVSLEDYH